VKKKETKRENTASFQVQKSKSIKKGKENDAFRVSGGGGIGGCISEGVEGKRWQRTGKKAEKTCGGRQR